MKTDQEINIAIAFTQGWKWYRRPATGPWAKKPMRALYHPELHREFVATLQEADMTERECNWVFIQREGMIQDYCADLNAIHVAINSLDEISQYRVMQELESMGIETRTQIMVANARQLSEAFLRTKGLWKE